MVQNMKQLRNNDRSNIFTFFPLFYHIYFDKQINFYEIILAIKYFIKIKVDFLFNIQLYGEI